MRHVVAGEARHLIRSERIDHGGVYRIFLDIAGAKVAVQALGVFEPARDANTGRVGGSAHILKINALQSTQLVEKRAVQAVVGVARDAGHVRRHAVILKVLRGDVLGVIDIEASSEGFHDMTGNTKAGLFGPLHVSVHPSHNTYEEAVIQRKDESRLFLLLAE
jgi:hypothetical protein